METDMVFKRKISCTFHVSDGDGLFLLQTGQFSWVEETNVSLQGKPSLSEVAGFSTLFSYENWVSYWREYFLQMKTFQMRKVILIQIGIFTWDVKKHICQFWKPSMLKTGASWKLFPCEVWVSFERNIPVTQLSQGGDRLCLWQIGLFSWGEEQMHLSKDNHEC
jgi:hypothetical protein